MSWLQNLLRGRAMQRDVADEIESHLEERAAELMESGMPEQQAWQQARREFGNATQLAEQGREVWTWTWLEQLFQDLRYTLRTLRRAPGFTAVAVLSLALGIGGNTAVFSLLDGVLLKNLPVSRPEELRILTWVRNREVPFENHSGYAVTDPRNGQVVSGSFNYAAYEAFRDHLPQFSGVVGFSPAQFTVTAGSVTDYGFGEFVTGNYFTTLGARAAMGRTILPSDDAPAQPPVAVVTYRYWSRRLHGDPAAVGSQILINRRPTTVIGIMPPAFQGLGAGRERDFFVPMSLVDAGDYRWLSRSRTDTWWVQIFGRLRPGVPGDAAAAALTATLGRVIESYAANVPPAGKPPVLLAPGARGVGLSRAKYATPFYVLGGTVCLVLLIACANLANLLLARASARQREIAIRLSIGAGKGRLIRQFFAESLLLSGLGGLAGLLLSRPLAEFLLRYQGTQPVSFDVRTDARSLIFTAGVSILSGMAFGLAPAWRSTRFALSDSMKAGGSVTHSSSRLRFQRVLVVAQVAFSVVLLVTAGLFTRTLIGLARVDLGFRPEGLLTFRTNAATSSRKDAAVATVYERIQRDLAALPGVSSVTLSQEGLIQDSESDSIFYIPGRAPSASKVHALVMTGADSFLATMRIPLLRGRDLAPGDTADSAMVAVVNEAFRKEYFPDQDPIGKIFYLGGDAPGPDKRWVEIVGVARNAHYYSVRETPSPTVYWPYLQHSKGIGQVTFTLRTVAPPLSLAGGTRRTVAAIDPAIPVVDLETEEQQIAETLSTERLFAALVSAFGVLAALLAAIGLYGILAYSVSRRIPEIGIRMALGATGGQVRWMILRGSLATVLAGIAVGVPAALFLTRVTRSLLYGVTSNDSVSMVTAALLMLAVSTAAAWLPVRRAVRVEPTSALRYE
jgi:predicted permease